MGFWFIFGSRSSRFRCCLTSAHTTTCTPHYLPPPYPPLPTLCPLLSRCFLHTRTPHTHLLFSFLLPLTHLTTYHLSLPPPFACHTHTPPPARCTNTSTCTPAYLLSPLPFTHTHTFFTHTPATHASHCRLHTLSHLLSPTPAPHARCCLCTLHTHTPFSPFSYFSAFFLVWFALVRAQHNIAPSHCCSLLLLLLTLPCLLLLFGPSLQFVVLWVFPIVILFTLFVGGWTGGVLVVLLVLLLLFIDVYCVVFPHCCPIYIVITLPHCPVVVCWRLVVVLFRVGSVSIRLNSWGQAVVPLFALFTIPHLTPWPLPHDRWPICWPSYLLYLFTLFTSHHIFLLLLLVFILHCYLHCICYSLLPHLRCSFISHICPLICCISLLHLLPSFHPLHICWPPPRCCCLWFVVGWSPHVCCCCCCSHFTSTSYTRHHTTTLLFILHITYHYVVLLFIPLYLCSPFYVHSLRSPHTFLRPLYVFYLHTYTFFVAYVSFRYVWSFVHDFVRCPHSGYIWTSFGILFPDFVVIVLPLRWSGGVGWWHSVRGGGSFVWCYSQLLSTFSPSVGDAWCGDDGDIVCVPPSLPVALPFPCVLCPLWWYSDAIHSHPIHYCVLSVTCDIVCVSCPVLTLLRLVVMTIPTACAHQPPPAYWPSSVDDVALVMTTVGRHWQWWCGGAGKACLVLLCLRSG